MQEVQKSKEKNLDIQAIIEESKNKDKLIQEMKKQLEIKQEIPFFPNREIECSEEKFKELLDDEDGGLTIRFDDQEDQPLK